MMQKQNIIYVISDFESNDKYDTLIDLIIEIRPLLFISTKQVFDKMKFIFSDRQDDSMILSEDVFSFVTLNDLSYDLSLRKFNGLSLPCSKSMTEQDKFLLIRSLIPTDSYNMIRSCGGLLKFIKKSHFFSHWIMLFIIFCVIQKWWRLWFERGIQ